MKQETEIERQARLNREAKEIARLNKEKERPVGKWYIPYLMLILCLVYLADELASNVGTQMQSHIRDWLFDGDLAALSLVQAFGGAMMILAFLYKTLSDKFGRKLFLVINTFCMGLGMFFVYLAGEFGAVWIYVIGSMVITFFITHDTQVVYIMESASNKRRATTYSLIKGIAILGIVFIPILRDIFLQPSGTGWNLVYLVPAIFAAVVAIVCLLTTRETSVFIEQRLRYLKLTDEERQFEGDKQKKNDNAQGGILAALKFSFRHKQLKWIMITNVLFMVGSVGTMYYETIMADSYRLVYGDQANSLVTSALFVFPFFNAILTILNGLLSDKIGRKKVSVVTAGTAFVSFVMFYIGAKLVWSPYVLGGLIGIFVGAFWSAGDTIGGIMTGESSPTNMRASIISVQTIFMVVGSAFAAISAIVLMAIFGSEAIGTISIFLIAPTMAVSLYVLFAKVGETKGLDLDKVKGDEWDNKKTGDKNEI